MLLDGSSGSPGLSRQAAWRPRSPSRPGASFSLLGFIFCPFQRDVEGVLSPATFHYENRGKLGGGGQTLGPGTGRVKAAPALEPARRGTSSGVLASPRVAKVQACKVGIGPARRGKKAWFPLPLPGVAPIGSAAGPAPPSPGAPRPHPRRSATPPSGQERGPELNERNSATLIGLGLDAAPRGRRGAENGARTCDAPPFL